MEILFIIGLILLNGILVLSEMSLVFSKKFKLEIEAKKGNEGAKIALELSQNPTKLLSTVQIGITLIGILLGVYSGENLTSDISVIISKIDFLKPYAKNISTGIIVILVTFLSIVIGELLPKRIGMTFPEQIAKFVSKPMNFLSAITSPFVLLLTTTNNFILKLFGIAKNKDNVISEEELKSLLKESVDSGEIDEIEHKIVERVFEFGDRKVNSLYTHRSDIIFFTLEDNLDEIRQKINCEKHSSYPVSSTENIDDIIGIVLLKDLFIISSSNDFDIKNFIKTPVFLNENMCAHKVLELFKKERTHCGIVIDEYGSTVGMVTMDDVIDAIVGDITENGQEEYKIVQRDSDSWLVDGQYSVIDFLKEFDIPIENDFEGDFTTVAGLIINTHEILPNVGDRFIMGDYELEIIDKDGQRIDKIMISRKKTSKEIYKKLD